MKMRKEVIDFNGLTKHTIPAGTIMEVVAKHPFGMVSVLPQGTKT